MTMTIPAAPAAWGAPRSKTITWYSPRATAAKRAEMTGRAVIEAIAAGELPPPPIASTFGFRITDVGDGEVAFAVTPDESAYNPHGMVHGGFVCTLLDSAVGCAVHTTLPAGTGYTTIELKTSFMRPVRTSTGEIHARGRVTKRGSRVAFAEGEVRDGDGTLLATATSSLLVMGPGA